MFMISLHVGSMQFFSGCVFSLPSKQCCIVSSQISELRQEKHNDCVMVFLYFVLPVFLIWLLQHYDYFSLSNKWLVHVPACFAALDNWFWLCFLFYFQSSIPDFTVTSSCTESSFSPSPGELIYYPQNSLCFHENCRGVIFWFTILFLHMAAHEKYFFQLCPPMVYIPQLFKRWIMRTISG